VKTREARIYFLKMIGEYYRYIAEVAKDDKLEEAKQQTLHFYELSGANDPPGSDPIKLGVALG